MTTSEKAKGGRPLGLRGPLRELAEALGSRRELAQHVGVDEKTIYRWSAGTAVPSRPARMVLAALAQMHEIEPPFSTAKVCPRPAWLDNDDEDDEDDEDADA